MRSWTADGVAIVVDVGRESQDNALLERKAMSLGRRDQDRETPVPCVCSRLFEKMGWSCGGQLIISPSMSSRSCSLQHPRQTCRAGSGAPGSRASFMFHFRAHDAGARAPPCQDTPVGACAAQRGPVWGSNGSSPPTPLQRGRLLEVIYNSIPT